MSRKPDTYLILVAVMILVCLTAGIAMAAPVTQSITYQGKLTNAAGTPLTGTYSVTFRLYDASNGGTALSTDTHTVTATNGLFTTPIAITASTLVDGRALWLGIKVGTDPEMTPRQEIRPVLYALGLRPDVVGASFTTDRTGSSSPGNPGVNVSTLFNWNPGVRITTSGYQSEGVYAITKGAYSEGVFARTMSVGSAGVSARTEGDDSIGVNARTEGDESEGVNVWTYGYNSDGVYARTYGYNSDGVYAQTYGDVSQGVLVQTEGDYSHGVYAFTSGNYSQGVTVQTEGANSEGVSAYTTGTNSPGIYGESERDVGVIGKGKEGGYFTTNQGGTDWWTDRRPAINVTTVYQYNPGMYVDTLQTNSPGVYSTTHGDNSQGFATTTYGSGSPGLNVYTGGTNSYGVYALSDQAPAIWASTGRTDNKYGVQTPDIIRALGYETGASDVAEYMPVTGDITPGTVLVIGADSKLQPSTIAYDTSVAGIVSTAPGVSLGAKEGGNPGEQIIAVAGRVPCKVDASNGPIHPKDLLTTSNNPGYAMKAVPVNIGGVEIYRPGTILGKAMGTLESGTGTIEVLVTLQ